MFGSFAFAHFADKSRLAHKSLLSCVAARLQVLLRTERRLQSL